MNFRPQTWLIETARAWRWRDCGLSLLVGSAALFNMGGALFFPPDFYWSRAWTYNVIQFGFPYMFALHMADRAVDDGAPAWATYPLAVVSVVLSGVWVIGPLLSPIIGGDAEWTSGMDVMLAAAVLLPLSIATFAYAQWRQGKVLQKRLADGELARARDQQLVQAKRLLALQARVEPQLLFDTLKRVQSLIGQPNQATVDLEAQTLLTDLIALLRIMQPHANATASSVSREIELVSAHARVTASSALQAIMGSCTIAPEVAHARLAPLVMLPLLRTLTQAAPTLGWQLRATQSHDRLCITVAATQGDPDQWRKAHQTLQLLNLETLRARLINVHGTSATLTFEGATITLNQPLTATSIHMTPA